jgi:hypothetical protein
MQYKYILGSGLVSLICRKILGNDWKIIPIGPSRFYSYGVPAYGDDFVTYDAKVLEIIESWGIKTSPPLFYKRPFSFSGSLMYNDTFAENYLDKIGIQSNPQVIDYFKTNFTVFPFSCIQLWNKLLQEYISEINDFHKKHENIKNIVSIKDHNILLDNGDIIEYDNLISTIPYNALCEMLNISNHSSFVDTYYYYISDNDLDLEDANQVLVCDNEIPFHKCSKISPNRYVLEVHEYIEEIYNSLMPIIGSSFNIIDAKMISNSHVIGGFINNDVLNINDIICVGSYAQCDPLIDISSVIKRMHNLVTKKKIK